MYLFFVEKTLQQDMLDFLQGARGQDFHDITLIVDGEPVGAHKVRCFCCCRCYDNFHPGFLSLKVDLVCAIPENRGMAVVGATAKETS